MNINQPITLQMRKLHYDIEHMQRVLRSYSELAFRAMFIDADTFENISNAQHSMMNALEQVESALASLAAIDEREKKNEEE